MKEKDKADRFTFDDWKVHLNSLIQDRLGIDLDDLTGVGGEHKTMTKSYREGMSPLDYYNEYIKESDEEGRYDSLSGTIQSEFDARFDM